MYTTFASSVIVPSAVRYLSLQAYEIDETTKEDTGYGVKTNHISKYFEGGRLFDG